MKTHGEGIFPAIHCPRYCCVTIGRESERKREREKERKRERERGEKERERERERVKE